MNPVKLLRPDATVASVTDVTPALLARLGARGVLLDLDDTLVASSGEVVGAPARAWLAGLRAAGVPVLILSNGTRARVARWSQELGVPGLPLMGKPLRRAFRVGAARLGCAPAQTAMVGDQLFTDVLGANLAGLSTVLVTPLSPGKLPHTRVLRHLERRLLR